MVLDEKKQEERLQSVKGEGQGKKVARFRVTNTVVLFWEYGEMALWEGRSMKGRRQWS